MVSIITGLLLALAFVIAAYILFKVVQKYGKRITAATIYAKEEQVGAFSVTGNLVNEDENPITNHYDVSKTLLGKGSSAEVVIGVHCSTLRRYAIKIIDISNQNVEWRYQREKQFLKDIDHTNVVRLFEVYKSNKALFFVMELCTGGHLGQVLKSKPENRLDGETARQYIQQLMRAISHCHSHGICHRDVKLQNILLESNHKEAQIKLVDFGNGARFRGHCPMKKIVGTMYTAAPEVFKECYDERCDIWSIGVVSYILLSGRRPFESLDIPDQPKCRESSVVASILMGRYHFKHDTWDDVSSAGIHFVQTCLEMDYTKRSSAAVMLDHLWLVNGTDLSGFAPGISKNGAKTLNSRLSRNLSSSGLRQTSMIAVAFAMPTAKAQQLRALFQQIDKNGSGTVERDEFHDAMQTINPSLTVLDIDVLFDSIDQDGNKSISFVEFVAATVDPREVDIQEMNQAFRLLDRDHKGYITQEDLRRVLSTTMSDTHTHHDREEPPPFGAPGAFIRQLSSGSRASRPQSGDADHHHLQQQHVTQTAQMKRMMKLNERILKIVKQADVNNDGVVSYTEFLFAMADGSAEVQLSSRKELEARRAINHMAKLAENNNNQCGHHHHEHQKHCTTTTTTTTTTNSSQGQNAICSDDLEPVEGQVTGMSQSESTVSAGAMSKADSMAVTGHPRIGMKGRRQSDSLIRLSTKKFKQVKQPEKLSPDQQSSGKKASFPGSEYAMTPAEHNLNNAVSGGGGGVTGLRQRSLLARAWSWLSSHLPEEVIPLSMRIDRVEDRGKHAVPVDHLEDSPEGSPLEESHSVEVVSELDDDDNDDNDDEERGDGVAKRKKKKKKKSNPAPMLSSGNRSMTSPASFWQAQTGGLKMSMGLSPSLHHPKQSSVSGGNTSTAGAASTTTVEVITSSPAKRPVPSTTSSQLKNSIGRNNINNNNSSEDMMRPHGYSEDIGVYKIDCGEESSSDEDNDQFEQLSEAGSHCNVGAGFGEMSGPGGSGLSGDGYSTVEAIASVPNLHTHYSQPPPVSLTHPNHHHHVPHHNNAAIANAIASGHGEHMFGAEYDMGEMELEGPVLAPNTHSSHPMASRITPVVAGAGGTVQQGDVKSVTRKSASNEVSGDMSSFSDSDKLTELVTFLKNTNGGLDNIPQQYRNIGPAGLAGNNEIITSAGSSAAAAALSSSTMTNNSTASPLSPARSSASSMTESFLASLPIWGKPAAIQLSSYSHSSQGPDPETTHRTGSASSHRSRPAADSPKYEQQQQQLPLQQVQQRQQPQQSGAIINTLANDKEKDLESQSDDDYDEEDEDNSHNVHKTDTNSHVNYTVDVPAVRSLVSMGLNYWSGGSASKSKSQTYTISSGDNDNNNDAMTGEPHDYDLEMDGAPVNLSRYKPNTAELKPAVHINQSDTALREIRRRMSIN